MSIWSKDTPKDPGWYYARWGLEKEEQCVYWDGSSLLGVGLDPKGARLEDVPDIEWGPWIPSAVHLAAADIAGWGFTH